jgi:hypothetical protein
MGEEKPIVITQDVNITMAFACENFSQDPQRRLYFHTVMDQINAFSFPATTPSFFAVFGFQRQFSGFLMQCVVDIVPENGDPINVQPVPDVVFKPDDFNAKSVVGFGNTQWPKAGNYSVRFLSRGKVIASFILRLAQIPLPGSAASAT